MLRHVAVVGLLALLLLGCVEQGWPVEGPEASVLLASDALAAMPAPDPAPRAVLPRGRPGSARIHEPGWSRPIRLPFNDEGWEDSPYLTRDGSRLLFFYHPWPDVITRAEEITERVVSDPEHAAAAGLDGKIYLSPRPFTVRSVHPVSEGSSPALECCPYLSLAGDLFYGSNRESWERMRDMPVKVYRNGQRLELGTGGAEENPHYCTARDELWFDCPGDTNLCVMRDAAARGFHGPVERAPHPLNASDSEEVQDSQAFLTDDCQTLYFTSSRGDPDHELIQIYRSRRLDEAGSRWSEPELFVSAPTPVAELSMTADGRELAFAQISWRSDGTPGIDIYYAHKTSAADGRAAPERRLDEARDP